VGREAVPRWPSGSVFWDERPQAIGLVDAQDNQQNGHCRAGVTSSRRLTGPIAVRSSVCQRLQAITVGQHWTNAGIWASVRAWPVAVSRPSKTIMSESVPPTGRSPRLEARAMRLEDVLRLLPERELGSLIQRMRIRIDESKRIDIPSQVARALLILPEARDPTQLPGPTRELIYRLAESRGVLFTEDLAPGLDLLVARGLCYVRQHERGKLEVLLPIAFMIQMRPWEGEDPRGIRALMSQLTAEVAQSMASHYLGRPATPPLALALEAAWEVLTNPEALAAQVDQLAPLERKLLRSVEEVGGEVDTEELLELEREPLRLRGATGATPSRRGVGFALERRALLIPIHPNRHVIPSEVAAVVGAQRRAERDERRSEIRAYVIGDDHAPRRARFAENPVPVALAMALAVREPNVEVRDGVGTPKSLIARLATRFGREPAEIAQIASLSRAIGLWDPSASVAAAPPGSHTLHALGQVLFNAWRRGGAWDEARADGESIRVSSEAREASAIGVLREMVLEALAELGDGNWAPWSALRDYLAADSRTPGIARLLERWASRSSIECAPIELIARRIALESLHVLGVVDLGEPDSDGANHEKLLRITPRGRAFLRGTRPSLEPEAGRFIDGQTLRVGPLTKVGQVLALANFIEVGAISGNLDLLVTPQAIAHALSAGFEADAIRLRLEAVASLPDPIARVLAQASAVVGRAEFVETQGFLWVEDNEVREMLRTRRQTADLFIDPSPPAGLLVVAGVDLDKLARRSRSLGVELLVSGQPYRTRSTLPPSRGTGQYRSDSSQAISAVRVSESKPPSRRRSGGAMPAVKRPTR